MNFGKISFFELIDPAQAGLGHESELNGLLKILLEVELEETPSAVFRNGKHTMDHQGSLIQLGWYVKLKFPGMKGIVDPFQSIQQILSGSPQLPFQNHEWIIRVGLAMEPVMIVVGKQLLGRLPGHFIHDGIGGSIRGDASIRRQRFIEDMNEVVHAPKKPHHLVHLQGISEKGKKHLLLLVKGNISLYLVSFFFICR